MRKEGGFLEDRGKSLEDEFFHKQDAKLIEKLRQSREREQSIDDLSRTTGISDPKILRKLLDLGTSSEAVMALSLIPLLEVAWADGYLDEPERETVLSVAEQRGITADDVAYQMLERWLIRRPRERRFKAWREYIRGLNRQLSVEERESLKRDILERARAVAEASGGFLGMAKISMAEARVLEELEAAFAAEG